MKATLIGFPNAGERWNWTGHAADVLAEMNQETGDAEARVRARAGKVALSAFGWTGDAAAVAPRRMDYGLLPVGLADIGVLQAVQGQGDITGATGRKGKAKRARAVGVGRDADTIRADELDAWAAGHRPLPRKGGAVDLAARADELDADAEDSATAAAQLAAVEAELSALVASRSAILAGIASDNELGCNLLALAGGAGYGQTAGRLVTLQGAGMAARAARYIYGKQGQRPSETSLQDAAGAAVAKMTYEWAVYSALCGDVWNKQTVRHLAGYGWRAAFHSYTHDGGQGMTGRKAGRKGTGGGQLALDTTGAVRPLSDDGQGMTGHAAQLDGPQLEVELQTLQAWAAAGGRESKADAARRVADAAQAALARSERKRALVWLANTLDVRAGGRTGASERARFSVLARLMFGRDIPTAARGAGFKNGRAALESFRSGKVWLRLRGAVASHKGQTECTIAAARTRAARAARTAIMAQRAARAGAGKVTLGAALARYVTLASGAAAVAYPAGIGQVAAAVAGLARLTRPAGKRVVRAQGLAGAGAVHPLTQVWAGATDTRGAAVALAHDARAALRAAQAARVAAFDRATAGMRGGWLRDC